MDPKPTYEELEKRIRELEKTESINIDFEAAKRINQRYHLLFKNMFHGAIYCEVIFDESNEPVDYRYLDVNDNFELITGTKREEIVGKRATEFHDKINYDLIKKSSYVAVTGEPLHHTFFLNRTGQHIEEFIFCPEPGFFATVFHDITERKVLEDQLSLFKSLVEFSPEAIAISDPDGRLVYINPAHERLFGRSLEEAQKMNYRDYYPPESIEILNKVVAPALNRNEGWEGILDAFDAEGRCFPLWERAGTISDSKGNLLYGFGLMHDDSERIRAEAALRDSEEKYRTMMEAMVDAAYITSAEFRIAYMNPRMISRIGRDATGEFCHKAIYDNDGICSWCVFDQVKQGEHIKYEMANPGDNRYYSVSNSPIFSSDKSINKLTIFRDITDTKTIEAQLQHARKMESIGTMAGGVAHDFNNLLYMITGNAELAMEDIPEWNPVHANLEEIKSAGLRAAGIVKQLLNFSRKADLELKPLGAVTVIKDALKFLRSTIPSSIGIQKHLPDSEVTILADPIQINQILMNICTNASQAMEGTGGILEITVGTESLPEGISSGTFNIPPAEYLKVEVRDTGPGIDPEIIDRIFDPYFTTKDVGQGSGMGLAVVHGIVKNHNGAITVSSRPGEGATFTVYFPISKEDPVAETISADKIPGGDESIIFIDDEKSIAAMGGKMLERLGYDVETRTNPVEVLDLFKSNPYQYDLIISDMTMPQMSGLKLLEKLKSVRSDIPAIICTGHSSLIDEEKAKKVGIEGFVMKPIVLRDIASVIRCVLDEDKS